jgi:AAA domain, putative AbiEii toxin, Type IV TA system/AAA domain
MPILKLHAENIGPFDKLELDLTDGNGNAHLGPHILAGVNGSGKTTVLRAIAWCLAQAGENSGFEEDSWGQFIDAKRFPEARLWFHDVFGNIKNSGAGTRDGIDFERIVLGCVGTYRPHPQLRRIEDIGQGNRNEASGGWLSFERKTTNEHAQQFWVAALSKAALATAYGQQAGNPDRAASSLRRAVKMILGDDFAPSLNIDGPFPLPALRFRGVELNFSQLAAGINATLAWVVDFLLRQEYFRWRDEATADERPGLLMIDEIETHLHPQWQRNILNGIRAAFPNTQIIVTTHSPFIVSSCPGARLHLFKLDDKGKAYLDESTDAPDAASISANIMDVFGIRSEFSLPIEQKLDRWNDLKRRRSTGTLTAQEESELTSLIAELAAKGEELSSIVAEPPVLPPSIIDELVSSVNKHR